MKTNFTFLDCWITTFANDSRHAGSIFGTMYIHTFRTRRSCQCEVLSEMCAFVCVCLHNLSSHSGGQRYLIVNINTNFLRGIGEVYRYSCGCCICIHTACTSAIYILVVELHLYTYCMYICNIHTCSRATSVYILHVHLQYTYLVLS